MTFFSDEQEIDQYIGEMFRLADKHPEVGAKMRAAGVVLSVHYTDPEARLNVGFEDPMWITMGETDRTPDLELFMSGDIADRFWRGKYNLPVGLAKKEVKAKGPVNKLLKLVPLTKPLFPTYKELVAEKDAASS